MEIISKIECGRCKVDTNKRVVLKRNPLQKLNVELPDGYEEFVCSNIIKFRRRGRKVYDWIEEECGNHILTKRRSMMKKKLKSRVRSKE